MIVYTLKRLLSAVPSLLGVMVIVFLLTRVMGDPTVLLVPPGDIATPEQITELRTTLGLDRPIAAQLGLFISSAFRGNFGTSYYAGRPAAAVVVERFGATFELAIASIMVAVFIGVILGAVAAVYKGSMADVGISVVSLIGLSMPNFWLGLMLMLLMGVQLQWLPISGRGSLAHLVLPTLTLSTSMIAIFVRLVRSDLIEVLGDDFVRTARAKGLASWQVIAKHALKNALIPTVTMVGLQFGSLLGGVVVIESIFAWPGLGRLLLQAIYNRDFPLVQAGVVLFAVLFILINLLVDLAYGFLDPRIRYV